VFFLQDYDLNGGDSKHISIKFDEFADKIVNVREHYILVIETLSTVKSLGERTVHNAITVQA